MVKKAALFLSAASLLCGTAMATTIIGTNGRGVYVGLAFSYAPPNIDSDKTPSKSVAIPQKMPEFGIQPDLQLSASAGQAKGYGLRVSAGYNFDRYAGLELGFRTNDGFALKYNADRTLPDPDQPGENYHTFASGESGRVNIYTAELLATVATPQVFNHLLLFAKAGVADVFLKNATVNYSGTSIYTEDPTPANYLHFNGSFETHYTGQHFHPEAVAGLMFNFRGGAGLEASYAYIPGSGKAMDKSFSPKLSIASIGFLYHF